MSKIARKAESNSFISEKNRGNVYELKQIGEILLVGCGKYGGNLVEEFLNLKKFKKTFPIFYLLQGIKTKMSVSSSDIFLCFNVEKLLENCIIQSILFISTSHWNSYDVKS